MFFAMGLFRAPFGETIYNNLKVGGCKSIEEAKGLIMRRTGEGYVQDDKRMIVAAVGRSGEVYDFD